MNFEFLLRRRSLLRGTLGAALFGLALFGMPAVAEEKRTPADLYVPTSAHFEADNGMRIQVAGLDDVQTLDDVLAFRERIAGLEFAREDLLSWKILGDMGLTKIEREEVPPPPAPPGVVQGPVRHLPEWRKATVDVDAARYAMRSVCEGYHMLRIDTPQAYTAVVFGKDRVATRVDHLPPGRAKNVSRFDIDSGLLRSEKRFEGEWETVRQDASGTLFKRTNSRDDGGRTLTGERYLLVDPARDEIRLWAFFINGRLYRFEIALRSLPAETSRDCVVPELVFEFDCSGKDWRLDMHRFEKVALDQKPADGAYSYLLRKGDVYQDESFAREIRVGGLDVPTLTPDAAAALIQAGKNGA